ncbi:MAG: bifunctional riboflavin kinase/FAD synthetase [Firmicutes bacterium]|nr:bifunctional riboflavin kinase/FAD synthetase [Bacillota bacterium]
MFSISLIRYKKKAPKPVVLALGFFECLHIGHRELMAKTEELAKQHGAVSAITLFSSFDSNAPEIFTWQERMGELYNLAWGMIVNVDFDEKFKKLSGDDFLQLLTSKLDIKGFVCGHDYKFGHNATCGIKKLQEFANKNNMSLDVIEPVKLNGVRVSSTLIRSYLLLGEVDKVSEYLGKNFYMDGTVIKGVKRGRKLGFPTANIMPDKDKLIPKAGVYKTITTIYDKKSTYRHNSITHIGARPTFNENEVTIETHILDFKKKIYDKYISVSFIDYIRPIIKFDSKEELITQLNQDIEYCSN